MIKLFLNFAIFTLLSTFGLCVEKPQPEMPTAPYAAHTIQPKHITAIGRDAWAIIINKLPLQSPTELSFASLKQTCKFLENMCKQPDIVHNAHRDPVQCEKVIKRNPNLIGPLFEAWRYFIAFQVNSKPFLNDKCIIDGYLLLIVYGIYLKHDALTRYLIGRYFYLQSQSFTDEGHYMPPTISDRTLLYGQLIKEIQNSISIKKTYPQASPETSEKIVSNNVIFLKDIFNPSCFRPFGEGYFGQRFWSFSFFNHAPLYGFSLGADEFNLPSASEACKSGLMMFYTYFLAQNNPRMSVLQLLRDERGSIAERLRISSQGSIFYILNHLIGNYPRLISNNPIECLLYNPNSILLVSLNAGESTSVTALTASLTYPGLQTREEAASNHITRNYYVSLVERLLKLNPSPDIATRYLEDQRQAIARTSANPVSPPLSPFALLALYCSAKKMYSDVKAADFWESYFNSSILNQPSIFKILNMFNLFIDYGFHPSSQTATKVLQMFIERRAHLWKEGGEAKQKKLREAGNLRYRKFQGCGVDFVQLGSALGPNQNFLHFCCNSQMIAGGGNFYKDLLEGIRADHYKDHEVYWNNGGETPLSELMKNLPINSITTPHINYICSIYPEWASLPDSQAKLPLMHIITRYFNSDLIWTQQVPKNITTWIELLINGVTSVDVLIKQRDIVIKSKIKTTPRLQGRGTAVQNAKNNVIRILTASIEALNAQKVPQNDKRPAAAGDFVDRASKKQELKHPRAQR